MRKCTACGNELATYAVYCAKCGKINPITSSQTSASEATQTPPPVDSKQVQEPIQSEKLEDVGQKTYARLDDAKRDAVIKTDSNIHTDSTIAGAEQRVPDAEKLTTHETMRFKPYEDPTRKTYQRLDDAKRDAVIKTDSNIHTDSTIGQPKTDATAVPQKTVIGSTSSTYTSSSVKSEPSKTTSIVTTTDGVKTENIPYKIPEGVPVFDRDKAYSEGYTDGRIPMSGVGHEFLNPQDVKYLSKFTFAPGCIFYMFSRAMGAFLLVNVALFFIYAFALPDGSSPEEDANDLLTKIYLMIQVPVLLWMGSVARQRRWKMLRFQSFNHFRSNEIAWGACGAIGWFFLIVFIILFLAN